ncbi:MAG: pyridoxamine 5'-phosphate oxidase family protein [Rhizobiales bacterium]|nr:pyridoxamine 5'-phosphate oxidase family protein [Hyphomicrobiales bacterium]
MSENNKPTSQSELRNLIGDITPLAQNKEYTELDKFAAGFINLSPFAVIGSVGEDGHVDVTPRGDPPGFVKIRDSKTLLIPERPGNRRVDTMQNLLANPQISIIFFMPGYEETLRIRGRASLTTDSATLEAMAVNSKAPIIAIRVEIDCIFFHCAKALKRSRLWDPEAQIAKGDFPRFSEIIKSQRLPEKTDEEVEDLIQDVYRKTLY